MKFTLTPSAGQLLLGNQVPGMTLMSTSVDARNAGAYALYPSSSVKSPIRGQRWQVNWYDLAIASSPYGPLYNSAQVVLKAKSAFAPEVCAIMDCSATGGFVRLIGADDAALTSNVIYYDLPIQSRDSSGVQCWHLDKPAWGLHVSDRYRFRLDPIHIKTDATWYREPRGVRSQDHYVSTSAYTPTVSSANGFSCLSFDGATDDDLTASAPSGYSAGADTVAAAVISVVAYCDSTSASGVYPLLSDWSTGLGGGFFHDRATSPSRLTYRPYSSPTAAPRASVDVAGNADLRGGWHIFSVLRETNPAGSTTTRLTFYVDGASQGSANVSGMTSYLFRPYGIGVGSIDANGTYQRLKGKVACARIIDRDGGANIDPTSVAALHSDLSYNFGIGAAPSVARQYWGLRFDTAMVSIVPDLWDSASPASDPDPAIPMTGVLGVSPRLQVGSLWLGSSNGLSIEQGVGLGISDRSLRSDGWRGETWTGARQPDMDIDISVTPASLKETSEAALLLHNDSHGRVILDMFPFSAETKENSPRDYGLAYGAIKGGDFSLSLDSQISNIIDLSISEEPKP